MSSVGRAPILLPLIGRAPWLLPLSLYEHRPGTETCFPYPLASFGRAPRGSPCRVNRRPSPNTPRTQFLRWPHTTGPPQLLLFYYKVILVRWSPSASFFAQKIALLSEQTHETKRILRGKVRVPPPNDELQTLLGGPVGPVHIAKMCGEATSYLFTFDATKLPAAAACHRFLGKFVTGRAQRQSS